MPRFTNAQYEASIPKCCALQTIEAHEHMKWCGWLLDYLNGARHIDCNGCPNNTMKVSPDDTPKQADLI